MATGGTPRDAGPTPHDADECTICSEPLADFRVLDCGHVFCVTCLEKMTSQHRITCPNCRRDTRLPEGLKVKHLRKRVIPAHARRVAGKTGMRVVTSWSMDTQITGVAVDEGTGTVVVASQSPRLRMYGMNGEYYGELAADRDLALARVAVDPVRGWILAADVDSTRPAVVCLDREGRQAATLRSPHLCHLNAVAYYPERQVYLLADKAARFIFYLDPRTGGVVRRIPASGPGEGSQGLALAAGPGSPLWVSTDWGGSVVRAWDADGACVRAWTGRGRQFGEWGRPAGVGAAPGGRFLVSDATNHRLTWLNPPEPAPPAPDSGLGSTGSAVDSSGSSGGHDVTGAPGMDMNAWLNAVWPEERNEKEGPGRPGDWAAAGNTLPLGLGAPREVKVTEDGLVVASMWNDRNGPFHVAVLRGIL